MKEKLIELLSVNTCPNAICNFCEHFKNSYACEKHKKEVIADHLIANGVTVPVHCKDCKHRGDDVNCPMCFEEEIEWDDDGYTEVDWITHDRTIDDGFCDRGERRTE